MFDRSIVTPEGLTIAARSSMLMADAAIFASADCKAYQRGDGPFEEVFVTCESRGGSSTPASAIPTTSTSLHPASSKVQSPNRNSGSQNCLYGETSYRVGRSFTATGAYDERFVEHDCDARGRSVSATRGAWLSDTGIETWSWSIALTDWRSKNFPKLTRYWFQRRRRHWQRTGGCMPWVLKQMSILKTPIEVG